MDSRLIDSGLQELNKMLMELGLYSYASFKKAVDALRNWKYIGEDLISRSYQLMMKREEINSLAIELIARYQPLASDLRYLKSAMEIAYNFLRIGRYSADIAMSLIDFRDAEGKCEVDKLEPLIEVVYEMLQLAMELIENPDSTKAENIYKLDSQADEEYRRVLEIIIKLDNIKCGLMLALVARYLERIGDHAYYIADSVYYYLNGYRIAKF
jgi:phosphate transport system protein